MKHYESVVFVADDADADDGDDDDDDDDDAVVAVAVVVDNYKDLIVNFVA
jgi:hypothetical protein